MDQEPGRGRTGQDRTGHHCSGPSRLPHRRGQRAQRERGQEPGTAIAVAGFDGVEDGEAGASLSLADALPYPITLAAWVPYTAQSGTLKWADGKGREALDPGGNQNDVQILGAFCNRQTGTGHGLTLSPFLETAFAAVRSGLAARSQGD